MMTAVFPVPLHHLHLHRVHNGNEDRTIEVRGIIKATTCKARIGHIMIMTAGTQHWRYGLHPLPHTSSSSPHPTRISPGPPRM